MLGQSLVDQGGPAFAPSRHLARLQVIEFARLLGQSVGVEAPRGHQQMCVVVALIAASRRCVDCHVDRAAMTCRDLVREGARELTSMLRADLGRQCDLDLSSDSRVLARLRELGGIPQLRTVARPRRGVIRCDDLAVQDAGLARVIVHEAGALVLDTRGGAIGRGRRGAAPSTATDRLHREVIDRHLVIARAWHDAPNCAQRRMHHARSHRRGPRTQCADREIVARSRRLREGGRATRAAATVLDRRGVRGRCRGAGFAADDANPARRIGGAGGKRPCRVPLPHANGTFA